MKEVESRLLRQFELDAKGPEILGVILVPTEP